MTNSKFILLSQINKTKTYTKKKREKNVSTTPSFKVTNNKTKTKIQAKLLLKMFYLHMAVESLGEEGKKCLPMN